jgi:hypothetical protein
VSHFLFAVLGVMMLMVLAHPEHNETEREKKHFLCTVKLQNLKNDISDFSVFFVKKMLIVVYRQLLFCF